MLLQAWTNIAEEAVKAGQDLTPAVRNQTEEAVGLLNVWGMRTVKTTGSWVPKLMVEPCAAVRKPQRRVELAIDGERDRVA